MPLLAFLGIAFIAAAITIPTYLVPKLKVVPLDLDITSDASTITPSGEPANRFPAVIFDRCSVSQDKAAQLNVNLKQQRRSVIVEPSNADQATLQSAQTVLIERIEGADGAETTPTVAAAGEPRTCNDGLLTASIDRVSVDRKSSAPNNEVSSLQLEADPAGVPVADVSVHLADRKGFQYKFGFDVQKQDYYYYDLNTRQDTVASFVEETTINGLKVYHFKTDVPETDLSELPNPQGEAPLGTILNMPAKWWGITGRGIAPDDLIEMHRHGSAIRHVWVEPVTGTIVDGLEEQRQYFKNVDEADDIPAAVTEFRMDALNADFKWSDLTVSQQVDRANKYVGLLRWGGTIIPIILGVLGALMVALWAWLVFRGRKGDDPAERSGYSPIDDASVAATPVVEQDTTVLTTEQGYADGPGGATTALAADQYWAPEAPEPPIDSTVDTVTIETVRDDFQPVAENPIAAIPVPPVEADADTTIIQKPSAEDMIVVEGEDATTVLDNPLVVRSAEDDPVRRGRHGQPD
ncbi:hypothetical protein GOHSU_25_00700 [Gordonia hirsuta DSM 44140 = NBRC 16056]|uniref:DUF3068 domain-containing protein n=2 Tax=Gordonia hirsuta TaxID=53427 RepID=L7L9L5_9ACTN|nr:hypothetical protein GOHSU_25_00700 [Gordonia hirsuta DSM 44140 = NBRC 16056]